MGGIVSQPALADLPRPFRRQATIADGSVTNVKLAGSITFAKLNDGAYVGKQAIPISVSQMTPTVSNGCSALTLVETTSARPDLVVRDFSTSADEHAQFGFRAPTSWNEGTVTFRASWAHAGGQAGGSDGVAWFLQGVAVTDDDTADQVYGSAVVISQNGVTAKDIFTTDESGAITIAATPVAGDYLIFRIGRDVSHTTPGAPDDLDKDARLLGITLFFTTDAGVDT